MKTLIFFFLVLSLSTFSVAQSPSRHLQLKLISNCMAYLNSDEIGLLHNKAVSFILDRIRPEGKSMHGSEFLRQYTAAFKEFMCNQGVELHVNFDGLFLEFLKENLLMSTCTSPANLSVEARDFGCQLEQHLQAFINEELSLEEFVDRAEELRLAARSLQNEADRRLCGLVAAIAKHSIQFWDTAMDKYYNILPGIFLRKSFKHKGRLASVSKSLYWMGSENSCKINCWALGISGVYGAWKWGGYGAITGGDAGAMALGLAGAAWQSGSSLVTQGARLHFVP